MQAPHGLAHDALERGHRRGAERVRADDARRVDEHEARASGHVPDHLAHSVGRVEGDREREAQASGERGGHGSVGGEGEVGLVNADDVEAVARVDLEPTLDDRKLAEAGRVAFGEENDDRRLAGHRVGRRRALGPGEIAEIGETTTCVRGASRGRSVVFTGRDEPCIDQEGEGQPDHDGGDDARDPHGAGV